MKTRIAKSALATIALAVFVSGCASVTHPLIANKALPIESEASASALEMQFGMARLLERNGKLEEARRAYLKILANGHHTQGHHTQSLHRLGVTAVRQNRLDAGLKHLSEAISSGNPTPELLGDYGYAQLLAGDLAAAEATLKQAVTRDPSQKRNINNLAIVVGMQNRTKESFQLFRQANPEAEALANVAFIQAQSEDPGQAKATYHRALNLDPELKIAAIGLMEVHNYIEASSNPNRSIESGLQRTNTAPEQRIARAQRAPENRIPEPVAQDAPARVLAEVDRPIQVPGREPSQSRRRTRTENQVATKLGSGTFQPRSFRQHSSAPTIAQVSYEEPVADDPIAKGSGEEIIGLSPPGH